MTTNNREFFKNKFGENRTNLLLDICSNLGIDCIVNNHGLMSFKENNQTFKIDIGMQQLFEGFVFTDSLVNVKHSFVNTEIYRFNKEIFEKILAVLIWKMWAKLMGLDVKKLNVLVANLIEKGGELKPHQSKDNNDFILEVSLPNKKNNVRKLFSFGSNSTNFFTIDGVSLAVEKFSLDSFLETFGTDKKNFFNIEAVKNFLKNKISDDNLIVHSHKTQDVENARSYTELKLALDSFPILCDFIFLESNRLKINYANINGLENICGIIITDEEVSDRKKQTLEKQALENLKKYFSIKKVSRVLVLKKSEVGRISSINSTKTSSLKQKNVGLISPFEVSAVRAHFNNVYNTLGGTQIVLSTHLNNKIETHREKTILDFGLPPGVNSTLGFAALLNKGYLIKQDGIYNAQAKFSDIELIATLLSHAHKDHIAGVPFLLPNTLVGLPLTLTMLLEDYKNTKDGIDLNAHSLKPVHGDGELIQLSEHIFIRPYLLNHTIPTVGYEVLVCQKTFGRGDKTVLSKIAYPSDYADTYMLKEMATNSNLFILDGTKPVDHLFRNGSMEHLNTYYSEIMKNCNASKQLIVAEMMKYDFDYLYMLYKLSTQHGRTLVLSPRIARRVNDLQVKLGSTERKSRQDSVLNLDLSSPTILILEKEKRDRADIFADFYTQYHSITPEKILAGNSENYIVVREADEPAEEIIRLNPKARRSVVYLSDPHMSIVNPMISEMIKSTIWEHPSHSHGRVGHAELVEKPKDRQGLGVLSVVMAQNPEFLAVIHSLQPEKVAHFAGTYVNDTNQPKTKIVTNPKLIDLYTKGK